mmetsp:Transcript_95112/g.307969  ORF Transcript_95112/g.307969 Transcript_95112/m.307969 type:complete len:95 (-) Transcript_95112:136-420(-)
MMVGLVLCPTKQSKCTAFSRLQIDSYFEHLMKPLMRDMQYIVETDDPLSICGMAITPLCRNKCVVGMTSGIGLAALQALWDDIRRKDLELLFAS